jgi:hypothetical protein
LPVVVDSPAEVSGSFFCALASSGDPGTNNMEQASTANATVRYRGIFSSSAGYRALSALLVADTDLR